MRRHPNDGVLRRLVDEPAGVTDTDREHVTACRVCTERLAAARLDAAFAATALPFPAGRDVAAAWPLLRTTDPIVEADRDTLPVGDTDSETDRGGPLVTGLDVDAAWERLRVAEPGGKPRQARARLRSPIIAGAAAAVLLAGAGAAAAADWFPIFRTERIAPITVHQADLMAMPDLASFGDVELVSRPRIHQVADETAAERESGLDLPRVGDLPRGVTGDPAYQAGRRVTAGFTFRAAKVTAFARGKGESPPPMPAGLDGSSFRLTAGPGAAAVWSSNQGVPSLIVARAVAPTAYSTGVPFPTARNYLLSLSGLPADVAAQLRSFTADGTTLPLHVMPEEMTSRPTEVGGTPATLLTMSDGTLSAVVWVRGGVVTAVAGSLSADEVLSVARGLR